MARSHRNNRRWCATHQMYYAVWEDAQHTQLARCPECVSDDARYDAAVKRRTEQATAKPVGDA
ncbi:MAG: hypothetical protein WA777_20025 [Rhodanobacter sp.]